MRFAFCKRDEVLADAVERLRGMTIANEDRGGAARHRVGGPGRQLRAAGPPGGAGGRRRGGAGAAHRDLLDRLLHDARASASRKAARRRSSSPIGPPSTASGWAARCPEIARDGASSCPTTPSSSPGPDGTIHRYRKLHPFTHAGEHERFRAGEKPVTLQLGGLRITPFICYDLRFADVFWRAAPETDVYLVPANWPSPRRHHWQTLLQARAIENQAYVVGCNRVGTAGDGTEHVGDTRIVEPDGGAARHGGRRWRPIVLADVDADEVAATRDRFRFLPDRRG